jgi:alpha-amylase/alpha-mannosidase (GH57 family)
MAPPAQATRYITIHGHFYQPPRENPWLEAVETQDSAAPYHDWNERITAECYATNGAARMVDADNRIIRIMNNYARISFNFGPTLLSWLQENAPRVYAMVRSADRLSRQRFGGHGSALAQVYNHIIMPLANTRDRVTQIHWGIADFEHRFHRKPEGMWLAETAVDAETLDLLAQNGIKFTILAPNQCARIRPIAEAANENDWIDTPNASVDTTQPYLVRLKEGRTIAVFFYNGEISRAIAFEGLLNSGEVFAARLATGFRPDDSRPQLVHVATDGESYGHHHRHGEMALAYALKSIEESGSIQLTNYGEFLAMFPPTCEAQINENTSWSCFHGVERWRANCGCSGGVAGYNQAWRGPLRDALDYLRDTLAPSIHKLGDALLTSADDARNDYIQVVLGRAPDNAPGVIHTRAGDGATEAIDRFFEKHAARALTADEHEQALQLMELERHAQLMYTSCGWFFDEISGIETIQIIAYACRVIELAGRLFSTAPAGDGSAVPSDLEQGFIDRLALAKSNVPDLGDGANIYRRLIMPLRVGLEQVAAHYAISSVFSAHALETGGSTQELYCYTIDVLERRTQHYGAGQITLGRARIRSTITGSTGTYSYAVLHFGDQNLTAAVKPFGDDDAAAITWLRTAIDRAVSSADLPEVVRLIDGYFGESAYSLTSLFSDEQRRILHRILIPTLDQVELSMTAIHREHASLLNFLSRAGLTKPGALTIAAQIAINSGLRRALEQEPIDAENILELLETARTEMIVLETDKLGYLADQRMKHAMVRLQSHAADTSALTYALSLARTLHALPFGLNLWQAQNIWYELHLLGESVFSSAVSGRSTLVSKSAKQSWRQLFPELGRQLSINVDRLVPENILVGDNGDNSDAPSKEPSADVSISPRASKNRRWNDPKTKTEESSLAVETDSPV